MPSVAVTAADFMAGMVLTVVDQALTASQAADTTVAGPELAGIRMAAAITEHVVLTAVAGIMATAHIMGRVVTMPAMAHTMAGVATMEPGPVATTVAADTTEDAVGTGEVGMAQDGMDTAGESEFIPVTATMLRMRIAIRMHTPMVAPCIRTDIRRIDPAGGIPYSQLSVSSGATCVF